MYRLSLVCGAVIGLATLAGPARAQMPSCEQMLYALTTAPPGVYTPEQAQVIANSYNANCLSQQPQYQQPAQQYQYQQQSSEDQAAEAVGEFLGGLISGFARR
jgi:hypothetical protein